MSLTELWNEVATPLLWLAIGLGSCVATMATLKGFFWLMDKLNDLD